MKPFLRWVGGKTWFLKYLNDFVPEKGFNKYHEPFLGGGSVFFHLKPEEAFLSDLNEELIFTYQMVQSEVESVISELRRFKNTKEYYYEVRNKEFKNAAKRAAQFIYLNQTSFNGIYRVNQNGVYNVPYGYREKNFFEPENLRLVSKSLQKAKIFPSEFQQIIDNIQMGDLVFLDPPYTITHNDNGFIKYNEKLFSLEDQKTLARFIEEIIEKDAFYILTNAAHKEVKKIFKSNRPLQLTRASLISGKKSKRGHFSEYIFSNIPDFNLKVQS
ncbi:MAG: Dam family site-specific DNA-(adenine-N6)-methyltransferase [Cyclobacteriaceae bacterium]